MLVQLSSSYVFLGYKSERMEGPKPHRKAFDTTLDLLQISTPQCLLRPLLRPSAVLHLLHRKVSTPSSWFTVVLLMCYLRSSYSLFVDRSSRPPQVSQRLHPLPLLLSRPPVPPPARCPAPEGRVTIRCLGVERATRLQEARMVRQSTGREGEKRGDHPWTYTHRISSTY